MRQQFALHCYRTRKYATQVRKVSAHTHNWREKRAIWSDIALFFITGEYGKSGEISRKKGNMVRYGPQSHLGKRASKICGFILPLKCLIWIIIAIITMIFSSITMIITITTTATLSRCDILEIWNKTVGTNTWSGTVAILRSSNWLMHSEQGLLWHVVLFQA